MIATVTGIDVGGPAKLRSQNNHGFLQKASDFEVKEQGTESFVDVHAVFRHRLEVVVVGVPTSAANLHVADLVFN